MSHAIPRSASLVLAHLVTLCACAAHSAPPASRASGEVPPAGAWTANGLPVCTAPGEQTGPVLVPDGFGGALIAWVDGRSGTGTDIYASRILANGKPAPGWTEDGTPVCTEVGDQFAVVAAGDGNKGVFLAWLDRRAGPGARLYLQHLDGGGSPTPGWPAGGMQALPDTMPSSVAIAPDYAGGVLVAWLEERYSALGTIGVVYATRITSAGATAPGWPLEGVRLSRPASISDFAPAIAADRAGGAYVTWSDLWLYCRDHQYCSQVMAWDLARIADGAIVWSTSHSDPIFFTIRGLVFAEDGQGGCLWGTGGLGWASPNLYGPAGGPLWPRRDFTLSLPQISADGTGGAVLTGGTFQPSESNLVAIRLTADGVASGWSAEGNLICGAAGTQTSPRSAGDASGGIYFCWLDAREGPADIYASRWTVDGARFAGWAPDGNPVARGPGERLGFQMVADEAGGAIMVWPDTRNGNGDIYAQRLTESVPVPVNASLVRAEAAPGRVRLEWWLPSSDARAEVSRREPAGDWRTLAEVVPDGTGRVIHEDHEVVPGIRYAYRLGILAGGEHRFSEEIWIDVPREVTLALAGARPNPSNGDFLVSLALDRSGPARLELLDSSGRLVETKALEESGPGLRFVRFDRAGALPPGIYVLRLTQAGRALTAKMGIVR